MIQTSVGLDFLLVGEVAEMLRVSNMTVYRLIETGEIPAHRVGRAFRIPRKSVEDYLGLSLVTAGKDDE